jgi:iron complex outermembrane receptor protein
MALSIPKIQLATAIVVCLSVASQASATDEPAYVGAGANAGPPSATLPQSVQVIDANTIATSGAQSIADLLRIVPDANPGSSRVAAFQSESLSVRGFSAGQIRNGMRQHHYADADSSALSNIERIEVLKGPSGVLYGPSGLGGVLHIITRQPDGQFGAQLWAALGSHAQKVIAGDFRVPVSEQLGLRVTGQIERSGTFVDHDNIDRENLAFTLRSYPVLPRPSCRRHGGTEWRRASESRSLSRRTFRRRAGRARATAAGLGRDQAQ